MSNSLNWMIYGATGYTGVLVAEEAIKYGHRPILAGRNEEKLRPLADRLNLEYRAFGLDDVQQVGESIADMAIVYHAAGPFTHTALPMIKACLATKTHYLDITGELNVFEQSFNYDEAASKNGIVIISGVGFDVVPTDCMARYVAEQVPNATHLEIALAGFAGVSAGTGKSFLEMMPSGTKARRNGQLETIPAGTNTHVNFPFGKSAALAIPWGDLSTGYRTTQIPNITTYMAMPGAVVTITGLVSPIGRVLFSNRSIRNVAGNLIDSLIDGPSAQVRETSLSYVWAKASDATGHSAEAWLQTIEPYRFTAEIAILAVERTATLNRVGALTPALAFGADFVLEVDGTRRFDTLS